VTSSGMMAWRTLWRRQELALVGHNAELRHGEVPRTPESWKDDRERRKLAPLVNAHSGVADACRSVICQPEEERSTTDVPCRDSTLSITIPPDR
jgi:hypothetical protein